MTSPGFDSHSHPNSHNLSRLSVCTSSLYRLSIESFDADADDNNNDKPRCPNPNNLDFICSSDEDDSGKEPGECYSLPATPPRRRNRVGMLRGGAEGLVTEEYASENNGVGSKAFTRQKCGGMVVIAIKDLGFELEHERMVELPGRVSGTSSGFDSPIPNWRISGAGKLHTFLSTPPPPPPRRRQVGDLEGWSTSRRRGRLVGFRFN